MANTKHTPTGQEKHAFEVSFFFEAFKVLKETHIAMTTSLYTTPNYFDKNVVDTMNIPSPKDLRKLDKALQRFYSKHTIKDAHDLVVKEKISSTRFINKAIQFLRADNELNTADQKSLVHLLQAIKNNLDNYDNFEAIKEGKQLKGLEAAIYLAEPVRKFREAYDNIIERASESARKIDQNKLPTEVSKLGVAISEHNTAFNNKAVAIATQAGQDSPSNLPKVGDTFLIGGTEDLAVIRVTAQAEADHLVANNKALCNAKAAMFNIEYLQCAKKAEANVDLTCADKYEQYQNARTNCETHYPTTLADKLFDSAYDLIEAPEATIDKDKGYQSKYDKVSSGVSKLSGINTALIAWTTPAIKDMDIKDSSGTLDQDLTTAANALSARIDEILLIGATQSQEQHDD